MRYIFLVGLIAILALPAPALAKTATPPKNWRAHSTAHVEKQSVLPSGFSPQQIRTAYAITSSGSGSSIAIVDAYAAPHVAQDLQKFDQQYGLPDLHLQVVNQAGTRTNRGWETETSLDVEWAHAIAPAANLTLISAADDTLPNLLKAVDAANALHPDAISMSWGGNEFTAEAAEQNHFNDSHISYVASAGDNGSQVLFPGVLSNVVSVGGTTLILTANSAIKSESAWSGSGGGKSKYLPAPMFQNTAKNRTVPDVAYNADPGTGYSVYATSEHGWAEIGGTSAGAPQWAALLASSSLQNGNTTNTQLYHSANSFHDVIFGGNGKCGLFCTARTGYDTVTGLGTPNGHKLLAALH